MSNFSLLKLECVLLHFAVYFVNPYIRNYSYAWYVLGYKKPYFYKSCHIYTVFMHFNFIALIISTGKRSTDVAFELNNVQCLMYDFSSFYFDLHVLFVVCVLK